MKQLRFILQFLLFLVMIPIGIISLVCGLPFLLLANEADKLRDKQQLKHIPKYLATQEGKRYFCYTLRPGNEAFINDILLPALPTDMQPLLITKHSIHHNNKKITDPYLNTLVRNGEQVPPPFILKIENGTAIKHPFNNQLYNTIQQGKDVQGLIDEVRGV